MVCYREGWLFEFLGSGDQVIDSVSAVEEGVFGMTMEMDERHSIRICDQQERM
jgi:hypothetical protein